MPRVISNINRKQMQTHDIRLETWASCCQRYTVSYLHAKKAKHSIIPKKNLYVEIQNILLASNFLKLKMTISNFYKFSNKNKKVTDWGSVF